MAHRSRRHNQDFLDALQLHHDALARFALLLTRSRDDAEDLVSDTVLAALESSAEIRDVAAMRTYLFRIAHRQFLRQKRRRRMWFGSPAEPMPEPVSHDPLPDYHTDMTLIREAMDRLSAEYREALVLIDVLGMPLEEAADIVQLSLGGLKARIHRARAALRDMLSR